MAYLQRLIWLIVGLALGGFGTYASAATALSVSGSDGAWAYTECHTQIRQWAQAYVGYQGSDQTQLAQRIQAAVGVGYVWTCQRASPMNRTFEGAVATTGSRIRLGFNGPSYVYLNHGGDLECVTGQRDPATGVCFTCPPDRVWNGTTCASPCQAKAGNSYGTSNSWAMLDVDTAPGTSFCDGSCSVTGGKTECESTSAGGTSGDYVSLGSTCVVQGPFTYTGQGCGPAGSMASLVGVDDVSKPWWDKGLEQKDCSSQGGYWGQVMGIDACVRPQPGETFDKETSTGNETATDTETAADGTTTEKQTTTSTECKDGKCTTTTTTTTTTKGADGEQVGSPTTESKTEVKQEADFCKLNPQHAQCAGTKTGGAFSGSCASGFTCSGDAVQCAIARAQHESSCALAVGEGVLGEFAAIQGFDGTAPGQGLDRKQVDVPTALDVAEIGGGGGLTDLTITVMGKSIEIPFSELNRFIEMLGYAIMMIAWVGAWRIISGAF